MGNELQGAHKWPTQETSCLQHRLNIHAGGRARGKDAKGWANSIGKSKRRLGNQA